MTPLHRLWPSLLPTTTVAVSFSLALAGCRLLSTLPDRTIVEDFAEVNVLFIRKGDSQMKIVSDPIAIARLRRIYQDAKWHLFADTVPADIVDISCHQGKSHRFTLLYGAGWLIEEKQPGGVWRKAYLDEPSRQWLDKLVAEVKTPAAHAADPSERSAADDTTRSPSPSPPSP